jgi:hypothetical protein
MSEMLEILNEIASRFSQIHAIAQAQTVSAICDETENRQMREELAYAIACIAERGKDECNQLEAIATGRPPWTARFPAASPSRGKTP